MVSVSYNGPTPTGGPTGGCVSHTTTTATKLIEIEMHAANMALLNVRAIAALIGGCRDRDKPMATAATTYRALIIVRTSSAR